MITEVRKNYCYHCKSKTEEPSGGSTLQIIGVIVTEWAYLWVKLHQAVSLKPINLLDIICLFVEKKNKN